MRNNNQEINSNLYICNVAKYRKMQNLSQEQLAELVDCSKNSISAIETYYYRPSIYLALKISMVLGVSLDSLFKLN